MSFNGATFDCPPSDWAELADDHDANITGPQESQAQEEARPLDLVGDSLPTQRLRLQVERIGPYFRTLVVQGDIGTGKELVSRALHERSRERRGAFTICYGAALAEAMEAGPIEASRSAWQPLLRGAAGTILLDGVDDLPLRAQARLLEIIREWPRSRTQTRLIASSTQELKKLVTAGRFRADLYHRLATIEILLEPLRRRREDIPALVSHFLKRFSKLYGKQVSSVNGPALQQLLSHEWPGNVRELENAVRNGVLRCEGRVLELEHLGALPEIEGEAVKQPLIGREHEHIESLQLVINRHVLRVLELCGGNKVRAAEILGISRSTLYRMLDTPL